MEMNHGTVKKVCKECGGIQIYSTYKIFKSTFESMREPCECIRMRKKREMEEEAIRKEEYKRLERQSNIESLKRMSMIDERFENSTFENSKYDIKTNKILNICNSYCCNFLENKKNNNGLLLYGNAGTGKTYSVSCVTNYLINKEISVICTSINGLLRQFKQTYDKNTGIDENFILDKISSVDLLIIDDLGTEQLTEWCNSILYEIIDTRYRANKPLIITTNLTPTGFNERYHQRINDRIFEMCTPVNCDGESLRKVITKNKIQEIKKQI